ncbi:MAG: sialidase family protein [Candidatus Angelobacter sp.]
MSNIQVTRDADLNHARSESAIVINPNNPLQIVSASKKFRNIQTYDFTLATSFSTDGGQTWHDSADFTLPAGATVMTDPTLAWDDIGNVYAIGLVGNNPPAWTTIGMVAYKSTDGGQTWSAPQLIHTSGNDDKQWCAGDTNPSSPFHGRIYAVWDDGAAMSFARTKDHGATWVGTAGQTPGTHLPGITDSFSPEINVAADGTVYIVWLNGIFSGTTVKMLVSTDGGDSFTQVTNAATGIVNAGMFLPFTGGFPHFPGGTFRVVTAPTACVFGQTVTVAWEDFRDGVGRIYCAQSPDRGNTWSTGATGKPMLSGTISPNMQHFFPQIITDPTGVIGCAFYEFGPKPTTDLIDVMMAESYDGGASFNYFTVTDQPWDPTVDAPLSHGVASVTFIGDYFGIDASGEGFYPLWTDTRTGIQELWTAIVPERSCAFIIERSTLGQDEIDARRGTPAGPVVADAFRVVVDGFSAAQIGVTGPGSTLNVASPVTGMNIICTGNTSDTGNYGPEVQRFTFHYNIDFGATDTAFSFGGATLLVTLNVAVSTVSASAEIELIKQPDPFILHGDPAWLSVDLRVFFVRSGDSKFGATMGPDASFAPAFIQTAIANLTFGQGTVGADTFGALPTGEDTSSLFVFPQDSSGFNVFNFAIAKVHYIGQIGAHDVRVFFRMFQAQSTNTAFDPSTTYRSALDPHGEKIPLAGIKNGEYVTIPFFASPRINTTAQNMNRQTDDPNVRNIPAGAGGAEVDAYYGCWLDINQPFKNVIPINVDPLFPDGPFGFLGLSTPLPIQQAIMRNPHQCLVAEISFDPVTIPFGKDPGNWDKLAQRNLAWSDLGSGRALDTFEVRATPVPPSPGERADELMIDWGNVPKGTVASIYMPEVSADQVLDMASRMYTTRRLLRADEHTLRCKAEGITYIPVPYGANINYTGLLSLDPPQHLRPGENFKVVVRQVTNAISTLKPPPRALEGGEGGKGGKKSAHSKATAVKRPSRWRKVFGAFQLNMPVHGNKKALLANEERTLSVMKWIGEAIPAENRWYAVFTRYLRELGGRVQTFGGDPGQILPSPTGDGRKPPANGEGRGKPFTGKISGLIFDHFGDFDGFMLETSHGERKFHSRETEIEELAERAWRERLRITVYAEGDEPHQPKSIVVHRPPRELEH